MFRRRWCNADERRDRARNMTIPARGWLVLRRVAGKHPPQHSEQWKEVRCRVQTQASRQNLRTGLDRRQRSARMTTLEAANGKSRKIRGFILLGIIQPSFGFHSFGSSPRPADGGCLTANRAACAWDAGTHVKQLRRAKPDRPRCVCMQEIEVEKLKEYML